ncbi:Transcriptional regulator, MarR family [Alloactinosynnema sp. L-07]|uniref:MarR family winged helix-turn-helix transcriptional regulator n=1 Tax=Alloactinosynnema sp. L-07 TaxID=1653480 RepID=UPI00065F0A15|nr:MarR family transcriptional regulator [Alloactinosynnema sp. L-07]CRK56568.1 Transcriptional regulator, MarR family [Alloactinosynnema sp. L-07]
MTDFRLDDSAGFVINRTAIHLKRALLHAFRGSGRTVTAEQWALLTRLWEEEGLSQVELAERTFNDKPNVTRMLALLERDAYVFRRQNEQDRRAFEVFLTEEGRRLQASLVALAQDVLARALDGISDEDVAHLNQTLRRIDANLASQDPPLGGE